VKKVKAFGDVVDALRVRETVTKEALTPDHPKWAGAVVAVKAGTTTIEQIEKRYTISKEHKEALCR